MSKSCCVPVALLLSLFLFSPCFKAADMSGAYAWSRMKIGGGGWVVGMSMSPAEKGLIYARTDVSGAYRWNPDTSVWKQLVTSSSLPSNDVGYGKYTGVDSLVGAPGDPDIAYMALPGQPYGLAAGQIFKSANRGTHGPPPDSMNPASSWSQTARGVRMGSGLQWIPRTAASSISLPFRTVCGLRKMRVRHGPK